MDANVPKHAWVCGAVLLLGLSCQEAPVVAPNTYVPETVRIGVLPDEEKLAYYEESGVTEVILCLPSAPRDEVLPRLDDFCRFL